MKLDLYLTYYTKIDLKWAQNLKLRAKTVPLLGANIGINMILNKIIVSWIRYQKHKQVKENINNWILSKLSKLGLNFDIKIIKIQKFILF